MGHRSGESRQQATLFPVMLDELVGTEALVRVIDAWVGSLDLVRLGFVKAQAQSMGRPPYDPGDLMRLYLWGYLNAVRSSRALERECGRNVECMWLLGRLAPDHKTIAEFRRCNSEPLVAACAAFVQFAVKQRLIAGTTVAIDGSKVRAVASRKAIAGRREVEAQARRHQEAVQRYLAQLDELDQQEASDSCQAQDVKAALAALQAEGPTIMADLARVRRTPSGTVVTTERDAQVMRSLHSAPGYNLQTAVETESHLIIAHEVTADATDSRQLQPMAEAASAALAARCTVVADAGYANGGHIAALDAQGIVSYVAPNRAVNNQGDGTLYDRSAFRYDPATDAFICPQGKCLARKQRSQKDQAVFYAAQPQDCGTCVVKSDCTRAARRMVSRHFHEEALHANQQRLEREPWMMAIRRQTVEHPFGTIKHQILGNARLLMRGKRGARSEFGLAVLAYNLKRAVNMMGARWMQQAIKG